MTDCKTINSKMAIYMDKFTRYVRYACLSVVFLLTSCVRDGADDDDCYAYVRFIYDYNMEYVDLFPKKATIIDLYIFDENGVFVKVVQDRNGSFADDFKIQLPLPFEEKTYNFVAWSGLYDQSYICPPTMTPGVSTMNDLEVQVQGFQQKYVCDELHPLWHGVLKAKIGVQRNQVLTIELIKDTNKFRVVMQNLDGSPIDVSNYEVYLSSPNGHYNCHNIIQDDAATPIKYDSYYTANDAQTGAITELNTMRLSTEKTNTLHINHKISGQTLDIPLNTYINALRLQEHAYMPLQEYMDREDAYHVLIFFTPKPGGEDGYLSADINIQPWYIRDSEVDD